MNKLIKNSNGVTALSHTEIVWTGLCYFRRRLGMDKREINQREQWLRIVFIFPAD